MTFYCYAENLRSHAVHAWVICYPNLRKPPRVVTVWVPRHSVRVTWPSCLLA